ncbi:MAG: DNA repair exonuclease [Nanohaloarchaea archaeon]|nr:DNA repair exonuclease [Candidatus Nanohaloarchaea archaeon]
MKVSIISDTHFGFKWGEERGEDPFENAKEAFERTKDSDLIILPGDIFDKKIPKQEVLDKASEVFTIAMEGDRTVEADRDLGMHGEGIPLASIHGTHERRPRSYTNPIELMAKTGHLHHIDNDCTVFEKDGEKVAVHGMSGVPERYAPKVLEKFDPQPKEDAFNILVIHQSVEGFVYTDDNHEYLSLEDFPEGFDLIINGHIHWYNLERFPGDKPFILPGSTVTTQMNKVEAEKDKGFLTLDTEEEELDFHSLENPRDVEYIEIDVDNDPWEEVKQEAVEELEKLASREKKPLVNLKIRGETEGRVNPRELKQMFRDRMFLNVNSSIDTSGVGEKASIQERTDPWQKGKKILSEKIDSELEIEQDEFLQLLTDGKPDEAESVLKEAVDE